MIRNAGELIDAIREAVLMHNADPRTRIIFREGEFGLERALEHVKVRTTMRGPEIILQGSVTPLDG